MEFVAAFLLIIAVISAIITRWTHLHPLLVAAIAGMPGATLAFLVAGVALSDAVWFAAGIGFVITAGCGALGAFIGWLRREHVKRDR